MRLFRTLLSASLLIALAGAANGAEPANRARVLMVVTSADRFPDNQQPTGLWLSELAHPYYKFTESGITVDIASPKGGEAPIDPRSLPSNPRSPDSGDVLGRRFLSRSQDVAKLKQTKKLEEIDPSAYTAVVFVGGHGALFDLADNAEVDRIGRAIYDAGGVIAAICHGPAALLGIKEADGTPWVQGKTVTGFSKEEEPLTEGNLGVKLPYYLDEALAKKGALYVKRAPWSKHVVTSGRIITAQNPNSSDAFADALLRALAEPAPAQAN